MKRLILLSGLTVSILTTSCVSKKKYTALQDKYQTSQSALYKANSELDQINARVENYYAKINSLQEENSRKLELTGEGTVMSEKSKEAMRETLKKVDPAKLAEAKTLSDSIDLAVAYNLQQSFGGEDSGIDVNVDRTIVEITVSDDLMFKSSSYWVNPKAYDLLEKIANVAKSEPAMEVLIEGHTDNRTFVKGSYIQDNWDLSARRAASVARILQDKFDVNGKQLIISGRSSYKPIADNATKAGRQENRRTRIIILPNLDKFLAMLDSSNA